MCITVYLIDSVGLLKPSYLCLIKADKIFLTIECVWNLNWIFCLLFYFLFIFILKSTEGTSISGFFNSISMQTTAILQMYSLRPCRVQWNATYSTLLDTYTNYTIALNFTDSMCFIFLPTITGYLYYVWVSWWNAGK